MKHLAIVLVIPFFCFFASAQTPSFENLTIDQVGEVVGEFSTNLIHTSASSPSSLGKIFGVEVGVIAGLTQAKTIEEISKNQDPNLEIPAIPHAWILANIHLPLGFVVELNGLPSLDYQGISFQHFSGGVKWSITDGLLSRLPFDLAVRAYFSRSSIGFSQTVSSVSAGTIGAEVGYEAQTVGSDVYFGFDGALFEPYVAVGYINTNATLSGEASADPGFSIFTTGVQSLGVVRNSIRLIVGCQISLPLVKMGMEYTNAFRTHRASLKLGLAF